MSYPPNKQSTLAASPLAQPRVQWTLAAIALTAMAAMACTHLLSRQQHNPVERSSEATLLRIDLNRADWRELALLPGVGKVLAERIVANREGLGDFRCVDDLSRVHGIGEKTVERLRESCEVNLDAEAKVARLPP